MAKAPAKTATKAPSKKVTAKSTAPDIEKLSEAALAKLRALNIDSQLQSDIEWCLGSYRADGNPVGLYDMARRAVSVFKEELAKKTKGVTSKLVSDLENLIAAK